ncbi:hypothetical protein JCM8097_002190 [Rhodosporidiobolus ruineniae]
MLLTLPPELVDRIVRFAALPEHNTALYPARQATLRACCLTCSVLRHIAQPILGKIVSFIDETTFDLYAARYSSEAPDVIELTVPPLDRPWTAIADPVPSPLLLAQLDALILLAHPRGSLPAITCISPSRVLLTGSSKDLDRAVATSPFPRANTHTSGRPFELLGTFADLLLSLNLSEVRLPLLCLPPSFRPGHPDFPKGAQAAILDHLNDACKARNVEVAWLDAGVDLVDGFWRYARKKRAEEERE